MIQSSGWRGFDWITCALFLVIVLGMIPVGMKAWQAFQAWNRRRISRKKFWDSQGW